MSPTESEAMRALRRELHRHPELAWQEHSSRDRIAARLQALGLSPRPMASTGLVLDLPGRAEGPRVALRADTDALPIHEDTGLSFASEVPGVMHACGHDGHSAMLLGAAMSLQRDPAALPVRLLWQPAEEKGEGARAMIREGVLDGVGLIFGGHLDRRYPTGSLVVTEGAVNASTDVFAVSILGQEGHGARPHEAVDAIVVGSILVTALQTIVSREVNPGHPAVVSVGRFSAGTAPNIIAGKAQLEGTVRAQDPAVREHLVRSICRIADAVGLMHGAKITVSVREGTPPVINTPEMTELARLAALRVVGAASITRLCSANLGGEDFACYLEKVPGAYIRIGGHMAGRDNPPAHSGRFDFDEDALPVGAAWLAEVARVGADWLRQRDLG